MRAFSKPDKAWGFTVDGEQDRCDRAARRWGRPSTKIFRINFLDENGKVERTSRILKENEVILVGN